MTESVAQRTTIGNPLERLARVTEINTRMLAMVVALVVIWAVFEVRTEGIFLSARNLYNLAVQTSVVGIMATGMVLIIVARHIDLSVGSVLGFTGMAIAFLQVEVFPIGSGWNWPASIVFGLLLGFAVGAFQGYWVAYRGVPAFVVTLGGLLMFRGAAFLVSEGRTISPLDPSYDVLGGGISGSIGGTASWVLGLVAVVMVGWSTIRQRAARRRFDFPQKPIWADVGIAVVTAALIIGFVLVMNAYKVPQTDIASGIPVPVLLMIVVVIFMTFLSRRTKFGRYVFAMGGNPEAAQLSGIDVRRTTLLIFAAMGVLASIAAVVTTARLNAATNAIGTLQELNVIAATVIGGTSLAGGIGTIPGAILGAVIMQSLENGMVLEGVSSALRQIIIGVVLILAVWFDVAYNKRRR